MVGNTGKGPLCILQTMLAQISLGRHIRAFIVCYESMDSIVPVYVDEQRMLRSDCMDVHADLGSWTYIVHKLCKGLFRVLCIIWSKCLGFVWYAFLFQTIEDHTMKNILRSVATSTLFKDKELEDLYTLFKVEPLYM